MTKPWVKVLEKVQLFERAHSPNESNTESSGFKINFTECNIRRSKDDHENEQYTNFDLLVEKTLSPYQSLHGWTAFGI